MDAPNAGLLWLLAWLCAAEPDFTAKGNDGTSKGTFGPLACGPADK